MTIIALIILLTVVYFINIRKMEVSNELKAQIMELESNRILKDKKLLKQSIIILSTVISLTGGIFLAFLTEREPKKIFGGHYPLVLV